MKVQQGDFQEGWTVSKQCWREQCQFIVALAVRKEMKSLSWQATEEVANAWTYAECHDSGDGYSWEEKIRMAFGDTEEQIQRHIDVMSHYMRRDRDAS